MAAQKSTTWRPYVFLFIGVLAVSTSSLFIRFAQDDGAPSLVVAAIRLVIASIILTPIALISAGSQLRSLTRRDLTLCLISGGMLGLHFATWISSLAYTSVINSVVLVDTNPLMVALATPILLRERLTRPVIIAVLLGTIGSVIVSVAGDPGKAPIQNQPMLGNILALAGAAAVAAYYLIGRRVRAKLSNMLYIWICYSTAAVVLVALMFLSGQTRLDVNLMTNQAVLPTAFFWILMLALVPQLIGHSFYNYALGFLSAAYVSISVLGEPVISTVLAFLFLRESPQPLQLAGGVLIFAALIISTSAEMQKKAQSEGNEAT